MNQPIKFYLSAQRIRKRYHKTLGTSVMNSQLSPLSLCIYHYSNNDNNVCVSVCVWVCVCMCVWVIVMKSIFTILSQHCSHELSGWDTKWQPHRNDTKYEHLTLIIFLFITGIEQGTINFNGDVKIPCFHIYNTIYFYEFRWIFLCDCNIVSQPIFVDDSLKLFKVFCHPTKNENSLIVPFFYFFFSPSIRVPNC